MTISRRDNYSLGCAGLAAGTNAGTFKTSFDVSFTIDGRVYRKAATDNVAFALFPAANGNEAQAALPALAANQTGVYFVMVNPGGDLFIKSTPKNQPTLSPNAAGYQAGVAEWPQEDKGFACLGAIRVQTNGSSAGFTPGTTAFGAANQTATYYNAGPDLGVPIGI